MEKNTPPNTQEDASVLPSNNHDNASSEMIGSIILIGVFVAAFAIILVMLMSGSSEFVVPAVVIGNATTQTDQGLTKAYVLNHRSGDILKKNEMIILVDGIPRTDEFASSVNGLGWTTWGPSESLTLNLTIKGEEMPKSVRIIYYEYPGGNGILLWDDEGTTQPDNPLIWRPEADFIADITAGPSPLFVKFTDRSSNNPTYWMWSFGDGTGYIGQKPPVHEYKKPGYYTVRLKASNLMGSDTMVKTDYIYVSAIPFTVDFNATPRSGINPLMVTFKDNTSGTPTAWEWDFGDGSPKSNKQNPLHTYEFSDSCIATSKVYTVTLNATVNGVTKTEQKLAYINVTTNCIPGLNGTYFDQTHTNYRNSFSGNQKYHIDQRLWFANDYSKKQSDIANWPNPWLGKTEWFSVIYEGYLLVPENDTYTLYLTSDDGSVLWLNNVLDTDTVLIDNWGTFGLVPVVPAKPETLSLTKGKHPIKVKMTQKGLGAVLHLEWKSTTIPRQPINNSFCHVPQGQVKADFTETFLSTTIPLKVQFTDLSIGDVKSWKWDFGDGTTSNEQNPVHTYSAAGVYSVILVVSDDTRSSYEERIDYIYVAHEYPGLLGTYYDNYIKQAYTVAFSGNKYTRTDKRIWFADTASGEESDEVNWPFATLGKTTRFSVEYEGTLIVPKDDTYAFHLRSDDGSVLWIDNTADTDTVLIDNWGEHAATTKSASKYLTKGKHPIRIKMTNKRGILDKTVLHLEWESPSISRKPVNAFSHGSGQLPIADFVADPLGGAKPLNVQFTDSSTGSAMTSWLWNFGDGTTSTEQHPMHTYASPGDYTVQLKAKNDYGEDTVVKTDYIHVAEKLTADFSGFPRSDAAPLIVTFTDQTIGDPTSWQWDFGDGSTSTQQHPSHTYLSDGSYTVTLQATTADNVAQTKTKAAYIVVSANCIAGLYGTYVDEFNSDYRVPFSGMPTYRVDKKLYFKNVPKGEWGTSQTEDYWPNKTLGKTDTFGVTYEGYLVVPENDTYTIELASDDGSVLWLDNVLDSDEVLINNWGENGIHGQVTKSASVYLTKGKHPIKVKMTQNIGTALLHLHWKSTKFTKKQIDTFCHIPPEPSGDPFVEYIINENVFVYGNSMTFGGSSVSGPDATIHINGALNTNDLNRGASIAVSNIYVDGSINLDGGSAGLGSKTSPGSIYVNGDLNLGTGTRHVYGDVYVRGNCLMKGPVMHGNVYINGDLELDWGTPNLQDAHVYYTGSFTHPATMDSSILNKCVKNVTVPGFVIPDHNMPSVKSNEFYSDRGYVPSGNLVSNIKIFADSYSSTTSRPSAENVIIVAKSGDITLTGLGGSGVTGILFAPNGKVTFNGGSFEGLVIARDGFDVTSGGTLVTFKNMDQYIDNPADYPF